MAERACVKRLQKEYHTLCKEPVPQVIAHPLPSDILEWHYLLEGSEGTPYAGGYYYGKIKFPPEYPYKPPSISMTTPSGRFAPHKKICLSMSDFHPETWNPIWSVSSILTGLLSFMMDDGQTTGSINASDDERRRLAKVSLAYNCQSKNCPHFKKLFPEYADKHRLQNQLAAEKLISDQQKMGDARGLPPAPPSLPEQADHRNTHATAAAAVASKNLAPNGRQKVAAASSAVPAWLLLLLVSAFGLVMALPLLQL